MKLQSKPINLIYLISTLNIPDSPSDDIVFSIEFPMGTSVCEWVDKILPFKLSLELDDLINSLEDRHAGLTQTGLQLKHAGTRPWPANAALFYGSWHRGEVVDTTKDGTITIFFADYVTVSQVPLHKVGYLLREYAQLSCQRCCLEVKHLMCEYAQ